MDKALPLSSITKIVGTKLDYENNTFPEHHRALAIATRQLIDMANSVYFSEYGMDYTLKQNSKNGREIKSILTILDRIRCPLDSDYQKCLVRNFSSEDDEIKSGFLWESYYRPPEETLFVMENGIYKEICKPLFPCTAPGNRRATLEGAEIERLTLRVEAFHTCLQPFLTCPKHRLAERLRNVDEAIRCRLNSIIYMVRQ